MICTLQDKQCMLPLNYKADPNIYIAKKEIHNILFQDGAFFCLVLANFCGLDFLS